MSKNAILIGNNSLKTFLLNKMDINFYSVKAFREIENILKIKNIDIILSNYFLSDFNVFDVLDFLKHKEINIPLIIISKPINKSKIDELKSCGIHFLTYNDLEKLPKYIDRFTHKNLPVNKYDPITYPSYNQSNTNPQISSDIFQEIVLNMNEEFINNQYDLIYLLDKNGCIVDIHKNISNYGYNAKELIGSNILDIIHPEDRVKAKNRVNERRTGSRMTNNLELRILEKKTIGDIEKSNNSSFLYFTAKGMYKKLNIKGDQFIGTFGIVKEKSKYNHDILGHFNNQNDFILSYMHDGVIQVDKEGQVIYVNTPGASQLGYNQIELIFKNISDFILYKNRDGNLTHYDSNPCKESLESGNIVSRKNEVFLKKDNSNLYVEYTISPIKRNSVITSAVITFKDISSQIKYNELLNTIYNALEQSVNCVIICDSNLNIVYVNKAFFNIFKYNLKDNIIGKNINFIFRLSKQLEEVLMALEMEESWSGEIISLTNDGGVLELLLTASIDKQDNKTKGYIFSIIDITKRKAIDKKLNQSEKRFETIVKNIDEYIYSTSYNPDGTVSTYHSPKCFHIMGYTPEDYYQNPNLAFDMIHPEDREMVLKFLEKIKTTFETDSIEHRVIHKSGEIRWVSNSCTAIFDNNGKLVNIDGFILDITRKKQLENYQKMISEILTSLNAYYEDDRNILKNIIHTIKQYSGIEGIELNILNDNGLYLFEYNKTKFTFARVSEKHDYGCNEYNDLCSQIINKQIDRKLPYITKLGSFWCSDLDHFKEEINTNAPWLSFHCFDEQFKSYAIIPIYSKNKIIGVLKLYDKKRYKITENNVEFFEKVANSIGIAFDRKKTEHALQYRMLFENFISTLSSYFSTLPLEKIDEGIGEALQALGEFINVDRGYIYILNPERDLFVPNFRWYSKKYGQISKELEAICIREFNWLYSELHKNNIIKLDNLEILSKKETNIEKKFFNLQGIKSILIIPMFYAKKLYGFMCFDTLYENKKWSDENIALLKIVEELFSNIFERKKTEIELKKAHEQLIHSEKLASLGKLVSGIAHEINNPINFIYTSIPTLNKRIQKLLAFYEEAEKSTKTDKSNDSISKDDSFKEIYDDVNTLLVLIKEGVERTTKIISDMQLFSKGKKGKIELLDINSSIESALNLLHNQYKDKIHVAKNFCDSAVIECNPVQINQVLMNILLNAIQAIEENGEINISTTKNKNFLLIHICDSGNGIDNLILKKIFDPFYTTKTKGTGLGLSICYEIIKCHKGEINVESEVNQGASFKIELPIKQ